MQENCRKPWRNYFRHRCFKSRFNVHSHYSSMRHMKRHSVFIVDDDQDDRESIRDAFLQNKHEQDYKFMVNGEQLIAYLNEEGNSLDSPIILLDLNMPGKDGKQVIREIKGNTGLRPIPIIVMTTSSSEKDKVASYELGANCFVTKPDSYKELVNITDSIAKLWFVEAKAV
ncbi:MAG: response regulator [Sphingobacteriales bacterium]|nr:MAG: response regulator [Sphingobacteriales bacterium]